jgi:hypothetical protein
MKGCKSLIAAAALGLLSASCGGDTSGGGSACAAVTGCGGDLTGVWHLTSICTNLTLQSVTSGDGGTRAPSACDQVVSDALNATKIAPIDATIEFTPAGMYVEGGTTSLSTTYSFTDACLTARGGPPSSTTACATVATNLKASSQAFDSATCTYSPGTCGCSVSGKVAFQQTGPYRTQGNEIFVDGAAKGGGYCVTGGTASVYLDSPGATGRMELKR